MTTWTMRKTTKGTTKATSEPDGFSRSIGQKSKRTAARFAFSLVEPPSAGCPPTGRAKPLDSPNFAKRFVGAEGFSALPEESDLSTFEDMKLKSLLAAYFHEYTTLSHAPRVAEPNLLMEDAEQVEQYSEGGELGGSIMPLYLLFFLQASRGLRSNATVADLGCGPGQLTLLFATCFPDTRFIGIDASEAMLARAEKNKRALEAKLGHELKNIEFRKCFMQNLPFAPASVDGIVSTLALHHLPDGQTLSDVFREIRRVLRPDGTVFCSDFLRPKSEKTVADLVEFSYQGEGMSALAEDHRHSLRAAFSVEEIETAVAGSGLRLRLSWMATAGFLFSLRHGGAGPVPQPARDTVARLLRGMPLSLRLDYRFVKLLLIERHDLGA